MFTALTEKPIAPTVAKPSPTKAGKNYGYLYVNCSYCLYTLIYHYPTYDTDTDFGDLPLTPTQQRQVCFKQKTKRKPIFALTPCPKPGTSKTGFKQVKIMKDFV